MPANQEASTLEPVHNNNTDIIEIDKSTSSTAGCSLMQLELIELFELCFMSLVDEQRCFRKVNKSKLLETP